MLKCSASLWSADLSNLASEIKRIEPFADRFHIDVADGQYVKTLLFFPDLVKAIRPHTKLAFDVHLITRDPNQWLDEFVEAGADSITFFLDTVKDPQAFIRKVKAHGKKVGVSLRLDEPIQRLDDILEDLDIVTLMGTEIGIKGVSMDPSIPGKIRELRNAITAKGLPTEIESDGGIRYETVPLIHNAGADLIVPGSLIFRDDPRKLQSFLAGL
jgi:ribulose-phosphate 3-epimerase